MGGSKCQTGSLSTQHGTCDFDFGTIPLFKGRLATVNARVVSNNLATHVYNDSVALSFICLGCTVERVRFLLAGLQKRLPCVNSAKLEGPDEIVELISADTQHSG